MPTDPQRFSLRFASPELRVAAEERAASKNLSLNEWVNRAITHAVTRGGKVRVTTVYTEEV